MAKYHNTTFAVNHCPQNRSCGFCIDRKVCWEFYNILGMMNILENQMKKDLEGNF